MYSDIYQNISDLTDYSEVFYCVIYFKNSCNSADKVCCILLPESCISFVVYLKIVSIGYIILLMNDEVISE